MKVEELRGIKVSPEAVKQARLMQKNEDAWQGLSLRLYLEGKGCDGFYYGVTFDAQHEGDLSLPLAECEEAQDLAPLVLLVDEKTLPFVKDVEVIWVDDERGRGFLVENPQQRQFRGKFFKRKEWLKKFSPPSESP